MPRVIEFICTKARQHVAWKPQCTKPKNILRQRTKMFTLTFTRMAAGTDSPVHYHTPKPPAIAATRIDLLETNSEVFFGDEEPPVCAWHYRIPFAGSALCEYDAASNIRTIMHYLRAITVEKMSENRGSLGQRFAARTICWQGESLRECLSSFPIGCISYELKRWENCPEKKERNKMLVLRQ